MTKYTMIFTIIYEKYYDLYDHFALCMVYFFIKLVQKETIFTFAEYFIFVLCLQTAKDEIRTKIN